MNLTIYAVMILVIITILLYFGFAVVNITPGGGNVTSNDTLQNVTDRGNFTTQPITVYSVTLNPSGNITWNATNHIRDNGTCVIIYGNTSTLYVC